MNPKDKIGRTKVAVGLLPAAGVIHGAAAAYYGAYQAGDKQQGYGPYNWRIGPAISMTVYLDALERHILALRDGEDIAADSGVHHLGHVIAGAAIVLDALAIGNLIDDRPAKGAASKLMQELKPNGPKLVADPTVRPDTIILRDADGKKPDVVLKAGNISRCYHDAFHTFTDLSGIRKCAGCGANK